MEWNLPAEVVGLGVALGCGLLIGVEREQERQITDHPGRRAAGVRTCALLALCGGMATLLGPVGLAVVGGFVALIIVSGYHATRGEHPGLTTEVALLATFLVGAVAMQTAALAAALAIAITLLLQSKAWLHRFARETLSETELNDALLLLASALIVLPLLPDHAIGPFEALNLRKLWLLVVLVMAINAAGYAAVRLLGPRLGLPLTGLAGGFVSSSATIGGMAQRSRQSPTLARGCAAAGMASNVSTILLAALLLGAAHGELLRRLGTGLLLSGLLTIAYAAWLGWRAPSSKRGNGAGLSERPFHFGHALSFAALIAVVLTVSQLLGAWFGQSGAWLTAAAAGFADAHAVTISMAELAAGGKLELEAAALAVLLALTTNTLTKALLTVSSGHADYRRALLPGLVLMLGGVWLGWWIGGWY